MFAFSATKKTIKNGLSLTDLNRYLPIYLKTATKIKNVKKEKSAKVALMKVCCVTFWSATICPNRKIQFDAGSHPVKT